MSVQLRVGRPRVFSGWLQQRVRGLAPAPVRKADLALFRLVARSEVPLVGRLLPRLSRAANHSKLWMAIALCLATLGGQSGRRAALRGLVALALTSTFTNLPAKLLTARARPDLDIVPEVRHLARLPTSTSFPSGHSASALAFATGASLEDRRLRGPLGLLAGAVAFSRVYTGVHYPGDVLAGGAIGVAMGMATRRFWPLASTERAEATVATPPTMADPDGAGLVVVANAGAGNALGPKPADQLRAALPAAQILEVEPEEGFVAALERACAAGSALGVAGGDGSASAAAAVAHAAGKPLALFPAGTLNHLAGDLGLDGVEASARAISQGRTIAMDIAEIDGHPFLNAAAIGGYPHLVDEREQLEEVIGKWPAVAVSLLRLLRSQEPIDVSLDGRRRRIWMLFAGNGRFDAPGLAPTRRTRLDDGLIDVRIVHAERSWARTRVIASALLGRSGRCAVHEQHLVRQLHVECHDGSVRIARDGESTTASSSFVIGKRGEPLLVYQPSDDARSGVR